MATSISGIGGVSYGGYPGLTATPSADPYSSSAASAGRGRPTDAASTSSTTAAGDYLGVPLNPYDLDGNGVVTPQEYQEALAEQDAAAANNPALATATFAALNTVQDEQDAAAGNVNGNAAPDNPDSNAATTPADGNGDPFAQASGPFDGGSGAFQNPVLGALATQAYDAVASASAAPSPRQQAVSEFA